MLQKSISFLCFSLFSITVQAQTGNGDFMRSMGKIYVVVAVVLALFLCIVFYLFRLDRKLSRLENQIKEND